MNEGSLHPPSGRPYAAWKRLTLGVMAALVVIACGVLLGSVLVTDRWTLAVTTVGLTALALACLADPLLGLLLGTIFAPFAQQLYLVMQFGRRIPAIDVTRLTILLLTIQLILQAVRHAGRPRRAGRPMLPPFTWVDLAMLLFTAAMLLSVPASLLGLLDALQTAISFIALPFLFYYFARNWVRTPAQLMATAAAIALVGAFLGLISAREQLTGITTFSLVPYSLIYEGKIRKVLSVFGSPAAMTSALCVMPPLLLYGMQQATGWGKRLLLGSALASVLAGVFFNYVRGGWLGALLGIAVLITFSRELRRVFLSSLPVILVVALLLSGIALINPNAVESRLTSEQPIAYRLTALNLALNMVRQSPLVGVGYENYGPIAIRQFGWDPHGLESRMPSTHNTFIYVLVSAGVLAFLPFLWLYIGLAARGYHYWRRNLAPQGRPTQRSLVAVLWATLAAYLAVIGTFDAINAQFTSIVFFVIVGALLGNLEDVVAGGVR